MAGSVYRSIIDIIIKLKMDLEIKILNKQRVDHVGLEMKIAFTIY